MGKTKRGKGTKLMAVADRSGLPLAVHTVGASPHEVILVEETLKAGFTQQKPKRLIGDRAYDSDPLDEQLEAQGIEMIALHRKRRKKTKTQDGRKLRRYRRRWKVERLFDLVRRLRAREPEPRETARETARARELAIRAHRALGCRGVARSDYIVKPDGTIRLLHTLAPQHPREAADGQLAGQPPPVQGQRRKLRRARAG